MKGVHAHLLVSLVGRELNGGAREDANAICGVAFKEALTISADILDRTQAEHTFQPSSR